MPLPVPDPLKRDKVLIGSQYVEIRELTRQEAAEIAKLERAGAGIGEVEQAYIAYGTDTPAEEVAVWYGQVGAKAADPLAQAIIELAGVSEEARKSDPEELRAEGG